MKTRLIAMFMIAVLVSACGKTAAPPPTSTPAPSKTPPPTATQKAQATFTPVCISSEPSQADIDQARSFAGDVLDPSEWQQDYTVGDGRVSVTWQNTPQSAVIFIEALIFPCGYEEPDLNSYFTDTNWRAIFQNYDTYNLMYECKTDSGLRLYQFTVVSQGYNYNVRYWVVNDTDTRVMTVMLTFPFGSESLLDEYSIKLFPNLPNCS